MYLVTGLAQTNIRSVGQAVLAELPQPRLYGRADITVEDIRRHKLTPLRDDDPPRHVNVTGWPSYETGKALIKHGAGVGTSIDVESPRGAHVELNQRTHVFDERHQVHSPRAGRRTCAGRRHGCLLLFTGVGAALSEKIGAPSRSSCASDRAVDPVAACADRVRDAGYSGRCPRWSLFWRVSLSIVTLAPLGVSLGVPFPLGLRLVSDEAKVLVPCAWGVNGFFTVIGTVAALMLGMAFGFRIVLLFAACCYLGAFAAIVTRRKPVIARGQRPQIAPIPQILGN